MERVPKENREITKRVTQGKPAQNSAQGDIAARLNNSPHMLAQRKKLHGLFGGAAQLQGAEDEMLQGKLATAQRVEEEEPLQGKFANVQRVEEEEPLQGKFDAVQRVEEEEPLQGKFAAQAIAQLKGEATAKPNNTGLPDNLKSGIENLSGMSMDNVKVHYNSSQPAQLNALAYAQGTDIHVAPGQEQHLPHEAWHVVQQAQGRVRPTMQMKEGVPVNDDKGLEHEADVMGIRAQNEGGAKRAGGDVAVQANIGSQEVSTNVTQLRKEDYFYGYRDGYREGFRDGMKDGLVELKGAHIIDSLVATQILNFYKKDTNIQVEYVQNYTQDYDSKASSEEHYEAGNLVGRGAGLDRGYEIAISEYGYDRQYMAIPSGDKTIAAQDNNGTCVYCNAHPIEDIDHIESLKNHWASRGSAMDKQSRSDETNNTKNLVGSCAACNRSKGSKKLGAGWWPTAWGGSWWPFGPNRVKNDNMPPPYW